MNKDSKAKEEKNIYNMHERAIKDLQSDENKL